MRLLILLLFPALAFGQKNCTGSVIDETTGKPVPYASIGLVKQNRGVSAGEDGTFRIEVLFPAADSFRISSVGYEPKLVAVAGWKDGTPVTLKQKGPLDEVVILSHRPQQVYTLNRFGHCSSHWHWVGLEAVYQRAQRIESPEPGLFLNGLELCKDGSESIFRIRIYDVDPVTGGPSRDLADTVIEVRSKESHVSIDLETYRIAIPGKAFFVAIEWLFIPFNEDVQVTRHKGKKVEHTYYKPAMRSVNDRHLKPGHLWQMNFRGTWEEAYQSYANTNFQITAKMARYGEKF